MILCTVQSLKKAFCASRVAVAVSWLVFESEVLYIPIFLFLVGLETENLLRLFCSPCIRKQKARIRWCLELNLNGKKKRKEEQRIRETGRLYHDIKMQSYYLVVD